MVDRVATLAWLAQEAAIELHPWTSRTDAPDRPTYALIDIDPGESTTLEEVLVLARLYPDRARSTWASSACPRRPASAGCRSGCRSPIYCFDQTRDWVEQLSRAIGRMVPDLVSWEWSKRDRRGRARLDFTQNAMNRTLVAPYSARPAPGAPVSAPITWEELDDPAAGARPLDDPHPAARACEAVGDLFAPALTLAQELPPL